MKKLFAITIGVLALAACSKESARVETPASPIRFSVSGEYTFTKATEAALANGDEIQIIAGAPVNAASKATVAETALNLATPLYWGKGQTAATNFVAIYPYTAATETTVDYNLLYNDEHNFDYHKMYLTAKASSAPTESAIVLPFKHPFSKVIINITNQLGSDAVKTVVMKGIKMEGKLNLIEESVDLTGIDAVNAGAVKLADNQYGLIVMPQTAQPALEITTDKGTVYTFSLPSAFTFAAGKVATAAVTLKGQGGSGDAHGDAVSFGFSVTDWSAAAENPSFDQGSVAMGDYWYAIGCLYDDDNTVAAWSKDFPMTYMGMSEGKEVWTITINYDEAKGATPADKGFKFRRYSSATAEADRWNVQLGMYQEPDGTAEADIQTYMNIDYDYNLLSSGNKNIRFETAGNYTLTLTGNKLEVVKN